MKEEEQEDLRDGRAQRKYPVRLVQVWAQVWLSEEVTSIDLTGININLINLIQVERLFCGWREEIV